jgi:hypothetical protein
MGPNVQWRRPACPPCASVWLQRSALNLVDKPIAVSRQPAALKTYEWPVCMTARRRHGSALPPITQQVTIPGVKDENLLRPE